MALNPNAPEFKPPFPDKPPQVSKDLETMWNWEDMAKSGTNPVTNIKNPYSTTSVAKGQGKKKKRNTRKTKKSKRKTRKHKK